MYTTSKLIYELLKKDVVVTQSRLDAQLPSGTFTFTMQCTLRLTLAPLAVEGVVGHRVVVVGAGRAGKLGRIAGTLRAVVTCQDRGSVRQGQSSKKGAVFTP